MFKFGGDKVEIGDSLVQKWSGACQNYSPRETERGVSELYQVQSNSDSGIMGKETLTGKETVALASFIVCILHRIFLDVDWVCMLLF